MSKEFKALQLQTNHLNALLEAFLRLSDPNVFRDEFFVLKSTVPKDMYSIPYVFISLFDPDVLVKKEENSFRYAFIGVGHPDVNHLIIRPYLKNMCGLVGNIYTDSKRFVPFQGTLTGFVNELSMKLKTKIERKDLTKGFGTLPQLFGDMHLFCQLPVGRTLKANSVVKFADVQAISSDFPEDEKEIRKSTTKLNLSYISDMRSVTLKSMEFLTTHQDPHKLVSCHSRNLRDGESLVDL